MTRDEASKILSTKDNQGMPITWQIGELVDSHGNVHYEDLKNLPTVDEYEIAKNYCKSRCLTMIDTLFLKEIFNLGHTVFIERDI